MSEQGFDETALDERLQALKRAMRDVDAPARVEAAVTAEFRRRPAGGPAWPRWALAAAAAVVMAVGAMWLLRQEPVAPPVAEVTPPAARPRQDVQPFIPLVPNMTWGPGESAQVMRVSMPRAALVSFGLPVDETRAFEMVRADIIVGQDMVARAIRIVR